MIYSLAALLIIFSITSCDLVDAINNYLINIPITIEFSSSGSDNPISEGESFCITDEDSYQEYSDDIKAVKFVEMAFRTVSFSPSNLEGNVTISLKDEIGNVLFSKTIPNVKPGDYINTPYILTMDQTEIEVIDTYLATSLSDNATLCLGAYIDVEITNGETTNSISGAIDIVFEAETEL